MNKLHIMLDLETLGTSPTSVITSIGAVHFNENGAILDETFARNIDIESSVNAGLTIDTSTLKWWMTQDVTVRKSMFDDVVDIHTALIDFSAYIRALRMQYDVLPDDVCIWGNGAAFDNTILANAYNVCEIERPWKFWGDRCYRTLKSLYPDLDTQIEGPAHIALNDAIHQANNAAKMMCAI